MKTGKRIRRRRISAAAFLLLCTVGCNRGDWIHDPLVLPMDTAPVNHTSSGIAMEDAPLDTITMSFVGDVMLASESGGQGYWSFNGFAAETDPAYFFNRMLSVFSNDDWTVANGENVFTDNQLPMQTKDYTPAYWYRSGTENASIYSLGSVEVVSLANNHALDFGLQGRTDTIEALEAAGIMAVSEGQSVILEKGGVKIGLFCCSLYSNYYLTPILTWLETAVTETDFQIVYYHGGTERVHTPEDWRVAACRSLVDHGADLVLGNHPHVLQPQEIYNGAHIVYSLGNFLFGGSRSCENATIVYRLHLEITEGAITQKTTEIIPCYCYDELWQPCPMEDPKAIQVVLDFMEGKRDTPLP